MVTAHARAIPWLLSLVVSAHIAQASPDESPQHYDLKHANWQFLLGESAVSAGAYAATWLLPPSKTCRWCMSNAFDESVRGALRAQDPRPAAFISHTLAVGAVPVLGLTGLIAPAGMDQRLDRGVEDAWIVVNTFAITSAVGETVKRLVARERPAFHLEAESATEFANLPGERNKSFFSLDTAWAFSIASSSATLAYLRGYSSAPYIAVGGGVLAMGAGTLRIVGDAHWATDVLTGAAVGTGIGIAMPLLLHGRRDGNRTGNSTAVTVAPLALGNGVSVAFAF
jgi:membrane-associated phospholipid phosphatase